MNEDNRLFFRKALDFSALGLEMGACVAIGVAIGYFIDVKFEIDPWGKIIGSLFGIAAMVNSLYKGWLRLQKMNEEDDAPRDEQ